jgi:hypothetical protein
MSEEALNGLLEKEGVTPDRVLGVPIMHAETFKRIMLHVRAPRRPAHASPPPGEAWR